MASFEMQQQTLTAALPFVASLTVLIAGLLQFTPWKARHLACCRDVSGRHSALPVTACSAWRQGLQLGMHCTLCCAGLTAVLLIGGVMNLGVMAIVGAAITIERLALPPKRVAQIIGAIMIVAGFVLIGRSVAAGMNTATLASPASLAGSTLCCSAQCQGAPN